MFCSFNTDKVFASSIWQSVCILCTRSLGKCAGCNGNVHGYRCAIINNDIYRNNIITRNKKDEKTIKWCIPMRAGFFYYRTPSVLQRPPLPLTSAHLSDGCMRTPVICVSLRHNRFDAIIRYSNKRLPLCIQLSRLRAVHAEPSLVTR